MPVAVFTDYRQQFRLLQSGRIEHVGDRSADRCGESELCLRALHRSDSRDGLNDVVEMIVRRGNDPKQQVTISGDRVDLQHLWEAGKSGCGVLMAALLYLERAEGKDGVSSRYRVNLGAIANDDTGAL